MSAEHSFEIWQDDVMVAAVSSANLDDAIREALHYVSVYAQDGPVEVRGAHALKVFMAMTEGRHHVG